VPEPESTAIAFFVKGEAKSKRRIPKQTKTRFRKRADMASSFPNNHVQMTFEHAFIEKQRPLKYINRIALSKINKIK
jgi:hypothetical protein